MLTETMRAAVLHGRHDLRIEVRERPNPGRGEVLIEVWAVGICGTDAHEYAAGPIMFPLAERHPVTGHVGPMTIGHEIMGRVVATGPGVDLAWQGREVVTGGGYGCERCRACRTERTNLCPQYATVGLSRDGGMAEYCTVPVRACVDATEADLSPEVGALAQPAAIAIHAMRRGRTQEGDQVAIVGCGGVGAFLVAACAAVGADVLATDVDPERLRIASDLGATNVFRVDRDQSLGEVIADEIDTPDLVFEVTGDADVLASLLEPRFRGCRIVAVGLQDGDLPVGFRQLSLRENEVIGTNALVASTDLPAALQLLGGPGLDWTLLVPEVLPLDALVVDGLAPLAAGASPRIKTVIDPRAETRRSASLIRGYP